MVVIFSTREPFHLFDLNLDDDDDDDGPPYRFSNIIINSDEVCNWMEESIHN